CPQSIIDAVGRMVRFADRQIAANEKVELNESPGTRLPRSQGVERRSGWQVRLDDGANQLLIGAGQCVVHQAVEGAPNEAGPGPRDVKTHQDRHQWIEEPQIGDENDSETRYDAYGGQHIGHQVLAVGFEDDRPRLAAVLE